MLQLPVVVMSAAPTLSRLPGCCLAHGWAQHSSAGRQLVVAEDNSDNRAHPGVPWLVPGAVMRTACAAGRF